ncbi:hypothetical protein PR048_023888 [Dryococelus australis]|uniref:Uncharacterized protein n=1 Tax=Dryococelus australis TaxID=614101 RepID=A0ABQ9GVB0_9NEOP|nr:hypothetical protein PR048_023888 [Dryococelus australis]
MNNRNGFPSVKSSESFASLTNLRAGEREQSVRQCLQELTNLRAGEREQSVRQCLQELTNLRAGEREQSVRQRLQEKFMLRCAAAVPWHASSHPTTDHRFSMEKRSGECAGQGHPGTVVRSCIVLIVQDHPRLTLQIDDNNMLQQHIGALTMLVITPAMPTRRRRNCNSTTPHTITNKCWAGMVVYNAELNLTVVSLLASHLGDQGFNSRLASLRIFACGNRAGLCLWSAGFLGDLPFLPPFHSGAAPYSPQSPTSALKTSMLRAVQISSLDLMVPPDIHRGSASKSWTYRRIRWDAVRPSSPRACGEQSVAAAVMDACTRCSGSADGRRTRLNKFSWYDNPQSRQATILPHSTAESGSNYSTRRALSVCAYERRGNTKSPPRSGLPRPPLIYRLSMSPLAIVLRHSAENQPRHCSMLLHEFPLRAVLQLGRNTTVRETGDPRENLQTSGIVREYSKLLMKLCLLHNCLVWEKTNRWTTGGDMLIPSHRPPPEPLRHLRNDVGSSRRVREYIYREGSRRPQMTSKTKKRCIARLA